jgi:hypothetical protein
MSAVWQAGSGLASWQASSVLGASPFSDLTQNRRDHTHSCT